MDPSKFTKYSSKSKYSIRTVAHRTIAGIIWLVSLIDQWEKFISERNEKAFADRIKIENEKLKKKLADNEKMLNELQQGLKQENQLRLARHESQYMSHTLEIMWYESYESG